MTKLSEKKGGGLIYNPPMMQFDGSTGYYSKTDVTVSGNKLTLRLDFRISPFSGPSAAMCLARMNGNGGDADYRVSVFAYSSDYSTADRRNKILIAVLEKDTAAVLVRVISEQALVDGQKHGLHFAYDGDGGTVVCKFDGEDDDLAYGSRLVSAGTLESGASAWFLVGAADTVPNLLVDGEIGFVGYKDAYDTDWTASMDQFGNPKPTDFSGWLFGHFAGKMDESIGTAGVMTKDGTITLVDPGECPHIGLPTRGTTSAPRLRKGDIAWVDGVEIVGTQAENTGLLLDYPFPTSPAGPYTLSEDKALVVDDSISLTLGSGWSIVSGAGLAKADAVDFHYIAQATMGPIPGGGRVAEMWGSIDGVPANNDNVAIDVNVVSGYGTVPGNWDFFRLYLVWELSNDRYVLYLARFDGGTWNYVAGNQYYTTVDQPADFHMIAIDRGDRMDFACRMFETDSFEGEVKGFNVTIPSRPKQATQRTGFIKSESGVTDNFRIRGIRITDL